MIANIRMLQKLTVIVAFPPPLMKLRTVSETPDVVDIVTFCASLI